MRGDDGWRWRDRDRFHVAITMDGNGRWALLRGRAREEGHLAGATAVRRAVESAPALGITTLTLYAFSSDNWRRPRGEVENLLLLLRLHLDSECDHLTETGVRLNVIGRRDRIPPSLERSIARVEARTRDGTALHLRVALDYSARDALLAAAGRLEHPADPTRQDFERSMCEAIHAPAGTRDVDLLIRTGGEQRLSDFLLWESAYAELYFTDVMCRISPKPIWQPPFGRLPRGIGDTEESRGLHDDCSSVIRAALPCLHPRCHAGLRSRDARDDSRPRTVGRASSLDRGSP